jgi:hypothetical protein
MAEPFGVFVCVYRVRPIFMNLFLFLKSHIWHGLKFVTELSKGLCIRLLCVRVGLCCTLRHVMLFLPELVKQCICVSFTKVMVGFHVMC